MYRQYLFYVTLKTGWQLDYIYTFSFRAFILILEGILDIEQPKKKEKKASNTKEINNFISSFNTVDG